MFVGAKSLLVFKGLDTLTLDLFLFGDFLMSFMTHEGPFLVRESPHLQQRIILDLFLTDFFTFYHGMNLTMKQGPTFERTCLVYFLLPHQRGACLQVT